MHIVAVNKNDPQISQPMLYVGANGNVTPQANNPHQYWGYTKYLWERYDPNDIPVVYDGRHRYDGKAKYQ